VRPDLDLDLDVGEAFTTSVAARVEFLTSVVGR